MLADLDRQADKGEALAKELGGVFVPCDVTNTEQVTAAVAAATEMGSLRSLVNAAGIGFATRTIGRDGSPHDLDIYKKVIEINLIGTFNCIRLAASIHRRQLFPAQPARKSACLLASFVGKWNIGRAGETIFRREDGCAVAHEKNTGRGCAHARGLR